MENKKDILEKLNEEAQGVEKETLVKEKTFGSEDVTQFEEKRRQQLQQSLEEKEHSEQQNEEESKEQNLLNEEQQIIGKNFEQVNKDEINKDVNASDKNIDLSLIKTLDDYSFLAENFYAGFCLRFVAYTLDLIAVAALTGIFNTLTFNKLNIFEMPLIDGSLSTLIVYLTYFILLTYIFGQTLGKMIVGVKVEGIKNSKVTISEVLFREVVGRFLSIGLFHIPYLAILFNSKKRDLADYIGDTVVIKVQFSTLRSTMNNNIAKVLENNNIK